VVALAPCNQRENKANTGGESHGLQGIPANGPDHGVVLVWATVFASRTDAAATSFTVSGFPFSSTPSPTFFPAEPWCAP
jgi:hypothetical protein